MSATPKVMTPTSVGRFVASIRSVASSSDGLVVCRDCRRHMSDMATSCPHCGADVTAVEASGTSRSPDAVRMGNSDAWTITWAVVGLAAAVYVITKMAGF